MRSLSSIYGPRYGKCGRLAVRATTQGQGMRGRNIFVTGLAAALVLIATASASADLQVCSSPSPPGKCASPRGLAVDFETGLLYVADNGNNRIDVFKNGGTE